MAQNQNKGKEACKKVSFNHFRTTFFGMSHKPSQPNSQIQTTKTTVDVDKREIQIFSGQNNVQNGAKSSKPSFKVSTAKAKSSKDDVGVQHEVKLERTKTNDKFSDYVKKVKDRMRKPSNVGVVRTPTKRDSFNDKVSNYINRAKIKIRTTTDVGDDKGVSFK
ncbi:hypothetical protein CDL12_19734 [Handroanthus impetiginosus]|uniref:Uncharacterized protein n=1 Tax=Handroanthus impetiginosus TaxID=429701 RepID=A0A2G9GQW0_9LAMI|nr:hypothetical protein CDL12_19734 [Handroanthus impetiginosus]